MNTSKRKTASLWAANVAAAICLLLLMGMMTGCASINSAGSSQQSDDPAALEQQATLARQQEAIDLNLFNMELIARDSSMHLYRDKLTDALFITYTYKAGYGGMGGLTQVLRPDNGLPMTYEYYLDLAKTRAQEAGG